MQGNFPNHPGEYRKDDDVEYTVNLSEPAKVAISATVFLQRAEGPLGSGGLTWEMQLYGTANAGSRAVVATGKVVPMQPGDYKVVRIDLRMGDATQMNVALPPESGMIRIADDGGGDFPRIIGVSPTR